LNQIWGDGFFVYLYREPRQTLASMIRAWQSGRFKTYSNLPGWTGLPWSLVLVPGWQRLIGAELRQIVAHQWATSTTILLDDLSALPAERVRSINYDTFLGNPLGTMESLARSLDLEWDRQLPEVLPASRMTLTAPDPEKWRELEAEIEEVWPDVAGIADRASEYVDRWKV
jgi:hypothetical protein